MGLLAYGIIALAVMGMVGTGVYKVKQWGGNEVRAEWQEANDKAKEAAEAERARLDALREQQDKQATKRLADEKKRTAAVWTSLEAHIKAAGLRSDCRITPELLGDANAAIAGPQGVGPSTVPSKPGTPTPAR